MKTLPLRELLRRPATVKKLTRAGQCVEITDSGKPLWVVHPADQSEEENARRAALMDEDLEELLNERRSPVSASKLVLDSRRL